MLPLLLLAVACAGEAGDPPERDTAAGAEGPEPAAAVCLQADRFVADGAVPLERGAGDAARVTGLRWQSHEGCERFVLDLGGPAEQPAQAGGEVSVEVLRDLGVVRVQLHGVREVAPQATDSTFDGDLARAAYAVWAADGRSTFVDVHLDGAAEAHAALLEGPARVVVDLRPGGGPLPPPPVTGRRVVVLEPRPGEASYPLRVTGYARTFEANVVVRLEQDREEVLETFTTATAWADAWGHYSVEIPDGPDGPVVLHVGEHSARDGSWEGVEVELVMRHER